MSCIFKRGNPMQCTCKRGYPVLCTYERGNPMIVADFPADVHQAGRNYRRQGTYLYVMACCGLRQDCSEDFIWFLVAFYERMYAQRQTMQSAIGVAIPILVIIIIAVVVIIIL